MSDYSVNHLVIYFKNSIVTVEYVDNTGKIIIIKFITYLRIITTSNS